MNMESLQQRREELERKEFQLKESLLKFDKFLKVCFTIWIYINLFKMWINWNASNLLFFIICRSSVNHSSTRRRKLNCGYVSCFSNYYFSHKYRKMIQKGLEQWKKHLMSVKPNVERTKKLKSNFFLLLKCDTSA